MQISVKIPDSGLITSVEIDGRKVPLDPPVEVNRDSTVIDLTDVRRQAEAYVERMGDKAHRDFIESS